MATSVQLKHSGKQMPLLGYGTWKIPKDQTEEMVFNAIKAGYRLLDCACDYGNEVQVGKGIKKAIAAGIVTREELFITSKLWNTYHRKEHVRLAAQRTLKDLDLEYLDLYLIHFPLCLKFVPFEERYPPEWGNNEVDPVPMHETWGAMEALVRDGLTRDIGVSNFAAALLMDVFAYATIRPSVLHIEVHPYFNNKQLIAYAKKNGLQITGYSNFGPTSYVELGSPVALGAESLFEKKELVQIAEKHHKTVAQVILRWLVQEEIAVIPKSSNAVRLAQNADLYSFELSKEEMAVVDKLDCGMRLNDPAGYADIPIYA